MPLRFCGKEKLHSLLVGILIGSTTLEISVAILRKLKTNLPYDPAIPFLGKCSKSLTSDPTDACSAILVAVLFTIAGK